MTTKLIPDQDFGVTLAPQMNLLVNGGFEQWQRGTSFSTPASGSATADRWKVFYSTGGGGTTFVISQESSVVDNGLALNLNTSAAGTGNLCYVSQDVENWSNYAGKTVTLSVRVKTSLANSVRVLIHDGTNNTTSSYHTGNNTWQTLTVTAALPLGISRLLIKIGALLNGDLQNGIIYIDSAMLIVGSLPVNFIPMHPADDLARCLRYYEVSSPRFELVAPISRNAGINYVSYHSTYFLATKSAVPTITLSSFSLVLLHTPLSGNTSSSDTANWTPSTSPGLKGFQFSIIRTGDQTTYPLASVEFDWKAEVT